MNTSLCVGVVCDIDYIRSICLSNYYYAIKNLFQNVRIVNSALDLNGVDIVFVGNDHYDKHKQVCQNDEFIAACNARDIKVCIYTYENILDPIYPHNIIGQNKYSSYKHFYQRVIDPSDAIALNKKVAGCLVSRHYKDVIPVPANKHNKCVFIGCMYDRRRALIEELKHTIDIDVIDRQVETWQEYMSIMASYRFVLSPYSFNHYGLHLKYYEALLVNSIPVHQITDNTLEHYTHEAKFEDVIYFKTANEVAGLLANCKYEKSHSNRWLEDELIEFFKEFNIVDLSI